MINRKLTAVAESITNMHSKKQILHQLKILSGSQYHNKHFIHTYVQKTLPTSYTTTKHLHINSKLITSSPTIKSVKLLQNLNYQFSVQQQPKINYNNINLINQLHNISQNSNKFHFSPNKYTFLAKHYSTISLDFEKKLQKIEAILNSQQKNLYKIVEQTLIVLQAFAQTRRRQVIEQNAVKVLKEFNKKIISAYLENLQSRQLQETERRKTQKKINQVERNHIQQTDNDYLLHENYSAPSPHLGEKDFLQISESLDSTIDFHFIFYYIETLKAWLLNRIESDQIIREAQEQIFQLFATREVSDLQQTLKSTIEILIKNYIEEPSAKKRQLFPFQIKLRGICLLSYFDNNQIVQKYLQRQLIQIFRLADENLFIYLKESQIASLLYDITEIKPDLSNLENFVYQVQSTKVYQTLSTLNGAYIKALFINYTRKFMVSFQEIQFYELFRDIQPKLKYPTMRTFIRLIEILKTEAGDLHCEYNKIMNKYNYNIVISIITSQTYTLENTKFDELFELFEALNSLQKSGQTLYDELSKYLKNYVAKQDYALKQQELQRIYKVFLFVVEQAKPILKYEEIQGLNKQFSKKSILFLNTLFDILLNSHPEIVLIGSKYLRSYILSDENLTSSSIGGGVSFDDREINIDLQNSALIESRMQNVKRAFNKVIGQNKPSDEFFEAILGFMKINVHLIKGQNESNQSHTFVNFPQNFKLLHYIYEKQPNKTFDECFLARVLKPNLREIVENISANQGSQKSVKELTKLTKKLYQILECINSLNLSKEILASTNNFLEPTRNILISQIKERLQEKQKIEEKKRTLDVETLSMATPKGNVEILLCLYELSRLAQKAEASNNANGTYVYLSNLPLIYNFINNIAIENMKSVQQPEIIPILLFFRSLQEARTSQKDSVLLLEIQSKVYQYLYSSMSSFIQYLGDRGKYYLKLNSNNSEQLFSIINHFVANKAKFRSLDSKKRLVILQAILVGLIRKKHLKVSSPHLKRSQHAKILLSFLQIFEYPQNINPDLKKLIEDVEFLSSDLQQFSNDILQRFSDLNWSISKHLEDNKVGLASSKKLAKLSIQELKKEFEEGRSSKIYEMILRNTKYQLPFDLPQPRIDDQNTKLIYIIEKIYQKISKKNNYTVPKATSKGYGGSLKNNKKGKKYSYSMPEPNDLQSEVLQEVQKKDDQTMIIEDKQRSVEQPSNGSTAFQQVDLQAQKSYIKRQSLVNYIYQDHYKMNENKLPLHFKKQTWKGISLASRQLEIQSLEIDQKIDENIYKQVMLALLGYVEKVKMVAKQFHSHSFIQYVAAQLDMEIYFHGCIARISRKNKPEDNVLFVCSVQSNYKLLYICTHILRESGENAYIISDKTKDNDFRDFLQRILPQPFESEYSEIVDKVVKGEIALEDQENVIVGEDVV